MAGAAGKPNALGLMVVSLAGLSACTLGAGMNKNRCRLDGDCNPGRVCIQGVCGAPGMATSDGGDEPGSLPDAGSGDQPGPLPDAGGGDQPGPLPDAGGGDETPVRPMPAALEIAPGERVFPATVFGAMTSETFTVTNTGGEPSEILRADLQPAAPVFALGPDGCSGKALAGGDNCSMVVEFAPSASSPGGNEASLVVSGGIGQSATAHLSGSGLRPTALALMAASTTDFGDVFIGEAVERIFVVTNTGDQASSPLSISVMGDSGDFLLPAPQQGECVAGSTVLDANVSCSIRVRFAPSTRGMQGATLSVRAGAGAPVASLALTANGRRQATLSSNETSDLGEVGVAGGLSNTISWTIENKGDVRTGVPVVGNSNPDEIHVYTNSCDAALDAGGGCSISFDCQPKEAGVRSGTITVTAAPGGTVTFAASCHGLYGFYLRRYGKGLLSAATENQAPVLSCDAGCSFDTAYTLVEAHTRLTVSARTENGSDLFFSGWNEGPCTGALRDCTFTMEAPTTVGAVFSPMTNNLIFVTSSTFPANRGSATAYDADCNSAASAAGINNAAGAAYIAFTSDSASLAVTRLGTARGWVRMDGKPFADTQASLFTNHAVLNPVHFDETGAARVHALNPRYMTGTNSDGTLGPQTCANWTNATSAAGVIFGEPDSGPFYWGGAFGGPCDQPHTLLCMGKTKTAAAPLPIGGPGKTIWITNTPFIVGGTQGPNAKCLAEKPSGVTNAAALIAFTNQPAAALLDPTQRYYSPDGALVGTGAEIAANQELVSGIWQAANGSYRGGAQWTGQTNLGAVGSAATTCGNWSDASETAGVVGFAYSSADSWWSYGTKSCSDANTGLYCIQTAP